MGNGRTGLQEALFNIQGLSVLLWVAMTVNKGRAVTLEPAVLTYKYNIFMGTQCQHPQRAHLGFKLVTSAVNCML